jgi:hypothetical protein
VFRVGAGSLRSDQPSGLSGLSRRLAQPLILNRYPMDLNPRTTQEYPCLRLQLLCALAPGQNVVVSVDCGLRLAASNASLMPTQNPIDPWGKAGLGNAKRLFSLTPLEPPNS